MYTTHVGFGPSAAMSLALAGLPDPVVGLADDLTSGPLGDLLREATGQNRTHWWAEVLADPDQGRLSGYTWSQFRHWRLTLPLASAVVIWCAENPAEVTGYLGVVAHLPTTTPVSVINVNRAYGRVYNTAHVQQYIDHTGEIPVTKLAALTAHGLPLSPSARHSASAQWRRLVDSRGLLRHIVNGRVQTVAVDYWDPSIIHHARALLQGQQPLAAVRLVGECLARHPQITSDLLVFWRIRQLVAAGTFTYTGSLARMQDCFLRLASPPDQPPP